ncbi:hypothetical protein [Methylocaldum sp. RMAD-M]|nr:hypothetical protein [Methylocaldum sp. RMAD-M]MBP1153049.1 hypothetical protein [Methylocaldum sp. RMAD-M]
MHKPSTVVGYGIHAISACPRLSAAHHHVRGGEPGWARFRVKR